jgi:hypothetical protein
MRVLGRFAPLGRTIQEFFVSLRIDDVETSNDGDNSRSPSGMTSKKSSVNRRFHSTSLRMRGF